MLMSSCRKYESGAVGSFTHLVALQGQNYACELEVWADGYQLKYVTYPFHLLSLFLDLTHSLTFLLFTRLVNPYVSPVLYIRQPGDDDEHVMRFPDDDPFFSEVSILIDQIEDIEDDPDAPQILSSFEGTFLYAHIFRYVLFLTLMADLCRCL